jgi:D-alanyl-D-alanine dipeptidase
MNDNFVFLNEIDPTIQQSVRYASEENFLGEPVNGYKKDSIVVTRECALALAKVQRRANQDGYSLVVYDGYRPQRAVNHFVEWSQDISNLKKRTEFYPRVDKSRVFELGFIAYKSGHSRGSTVDLTIIALDRQVSHHPVYAQRELSPGIFVPFLDDGTVDMGSSFDLFDEASHHDSPIVPEEYLQRRNYLKSIMDADGGFSADIEEWWHYTLREEPFPSTFFDFEIV